MIREFSHLKRALFLVIAPCYLQAMLVGNPAEPAIAKEGIFTQPSCWCTARVGFFEDYVYNQRFVDKFEIAGNQEENKTIAKLATNAGIATVNFKERLDLYGLAGTSKMQVNQEIYSSMQPCWGVGGKLLILEAYSFYIGIDVKYFATYQKPLYFVGDGYAYNVSEDFTLSYSETQTSIGVSFLTRQISPYIYLTYLIADFEPHPMKALVRMPTEDLYTDADCNSSKTQRRFGLALGATLLSKEKALLAIESRMFNQNAIDVKLELKF